MSEKNISTAILEALTNNIEYTKKVLPFLKKEYFQSDAEKAIFEIESAFFERFEKLPTKEILRIELNSAGIYESLHGECIGVVEDFTNEIKNTDWLIESSERFCKDRALFNAMTRAIQIMDGQDKKFATSAIPGLLEEAIAVSFDNSVGHDYLLDADKRWDYWTNPENKIPFDIDILNTVTKGGYSMKTLNIVAAGTNVGKTIFGCHYAASCLKMGKNVVYISMEMGEEDIGARVDANVLSLEVDGVKGLTKDVFLSKIDQIKQKTNGRLFVKQFETGAAHVGHFKAFINELKIKHGFVPHVIIIDYLNICASRTFPKGHDNSNTLISEITKELRGMMISMNCIGLTFCQFNREGMKHTDNELTDTADAIGATFNVDSYLAMNEPEELAALNQIIFKQLKNRYGDKNINKRFLVGLEKARMTFYNVEDGVEQMPNIGSVRSHGKQEKREHTNTSISQFKTQGKERETKGFKFN
jgi:replicative DNA helicase